MKLLIVDDQSTVVQGLLHCTNWAAMGFTVVDTALNAVDAKASLLRQEAEVMLCDIEMPMEKRAGSVGLAPAARDDHPLHLPDSPC